MKNCLNCGAPLAPDNPVCSFCGQRQPVDLSLLAPFTVVNQRTAHRCPDCEVALDEIRVSVQHERPLLHCPQCQCLGLSLKEMPAILEGMVQYVFHADQAMITALLKAHPLNTSFHYRPCPICAVFMNRRSGGDQSAVVFDYCTRDDLAWFDDGKLQKLCEWRKSGGQIIEAQRKTADDLERELQEAQQRLEHNRRMRLRPGHGGFEKVSMTDEERLELSMIHDLEQKLADLRGR